MSELVMAEGQKRRTIGKGIKSLGNKRVKPQKETSQMSEQSTTEGQDIGTKEAVLDPQDRNETPYDLEPEKEANSLQNLENSEATVARDESLEAALEPQKGNKTPGNLEVGLRAVQDFE